MLIFYGNCCVLLTKFLKNCLYYEKKTPSSCRSGKVLSYSISNFFRFSSCFAKNSKGKVTGPDAKPVFGATVAVKNTNVATTTNADGSLFNYTSCKFKCLSLFFFGYDVSEVSATGDQVDVR
jgi:hypothetical protein